MKQRYVMVPIEYNKVCIVFPGMEPEEGYPYIEYDVSEYLKGRKKLSLSQVKRVLTEIGNGLIKKGSYDG